VFISSKVKVNSALYIRNIRYTKLVLFRYYCCAEYGWVTIVEDNGTPNDKSISTHYRNLNQIETTKWVAQSPYLNLIENLSLDI